MSRDVLFKSRTYEMFVVSRGNERVAVFGSVVIPIESSLEPITERVATALASDYFEACEADRRRHQECRKRQEWRDACRSMASSINARFNGYSSSDAWMKWAASVRMSPHAFNAYISGTDTRSQEQSTANMSWDDFASDWSGRCRARDQYHSPRGQWRRWAANKGTNLLKRMRRKGLNADGTEKEACDSEGHLQSRQEPGAQVCFDWG